MSTHQTKDGRWYVKFWESGRSHKKYFGRGDQAKIDAEDYEADIKRIKRRGGKIIEESKPEKLHFDQLGQRYLDDKRSAGWTEQMTRNLKTGPRLVNLRRDFLQRLKAKQKEATNDYVIEYDGAPIKQLRRSLGTALTKAGIKKKVRPYDIRYMYGTYMAKNGGDIFAIKRLMGHSSITTTERYSHHAEQLQKEAIAKLPSLVKGVRKSGLVPKNGPQPSSGGKPNQPTI